ncbi:histidine phosphatase family protein [Rubrobacter aplysinae]|uniref:histidine phosphatase family protein n=1 Tax=Rubrobacter aplysinae TaxID=909625 RepID=UPI00069E873A|nr:histidine phosphatase family protein [Rubrobacter aplysinae]
MQALLVRHGRSTANAAGIWQGRLDYGLSEEGRDQAHRAGRSLAGILGIQPVHVYSSPLVRAVESARVIAAEVGYPAGQIQCLDDLTERGGGMLEGHTWSGFEARHPGLARRFFELPDEERWEYVGAESTASALERLRRTLGRILEHHAPGETVIVVSHGGLLGSLFVEELGPEVPGKEAQLANGSISRLLLEGHGRRVTGLGDVEHLR